MNKEKLKKLSLKLSADRNNYMLAFRHNIDMYISEKDITIRELSEVADIPYSTLNTFIYGNSKDCNLSTAVKLARALGVSIDELVGAETIEPETRECIAMSRNVPDYVRYLDRIFIKHQYQIHSEFPEDSKNIPILLPECLSGYLKTTNITTTICIDHLTPNVKSKVCLGLQIPCGHYEPFYMPNEVLLLSGDRAGLNNEKCVISYKGNYFIGIKKIYIENNEKKVKYLSIIDGKTTVLPNDVDDKLGYVVGFLNPDGTWGIR